LVGARTQIIEQLVQDKDQTAIGMGGLKSRHHFLESRFVFMAIADGWEFIGDPESSQSVFQHRTHDFPQRHRGGTDLRTDHTKPAGDLGGLFGNLLMVRCEARSAFSATADTTAIR